VLHDGNYYMFGGEMTQVTENGSSRWVLRQVLRVSDQFDGFTNVTSSLIIPVGSDGSFDSKCAAAGKIFQVSGDPRWFMIYQTSDTFIDYPDRFHAAYSCDLITWNKVKNDLPLMGRGERGEWDQGGIWTGSIIEYDGAIHIFYEGWGSCSAMVDRDELYYKGANSRAGVASVAVDDFLTWVDAGTTEVAEDIFCELSASGQIRLWWQGETGTIYHLQTDDNLVSAPGWSNVIEGMSGVGGTMSVTTDTERVQSFFRIIAD
jgi:hypothetical protein